MNKSYINRVMLAIGVASLAMTGCKKVLDTSPYYAITDASAFASSDKCALVLNGVYDCAQSAPYTDGSLRGYPFGAANIEQGDCRGEDVVNIQAFYQVTYQATYNSQSANCVAMWSGIYLLINKANIAIDGFQKAATSGIITSAVAIQYEAECRFLRAMAHHEALIHFARPYLDGNGTLVGVPWRDFPINSSTAVNQIRNTPRMRTDSVYTKILADLDFAETNLPNTLFVYRATKAAAIALKMRIKLHKGDWAGVITEGNKLVPATVNPSAPTSVVSPIGSWALTASPDGPFTNNSSTESIFSIKNDALDAPNTNAALSRMYGAADLGGRGLVSLSPIIWNNAGWLCDDKRRSLLAVAGVNASGTQSYFSTKYRQYTTWADYAPQIRYSEVLLTLAEAEARQGTGVTTRALQLLNVVRNRSLTNPTTQAYTTFATKNDLIKAILLERRIEFLAEGKRWSDISRLAKDADFTTNGIPAKAVNGAAGLSIFVCGGGYTPGQAAIAYSDYRFLWPISSTEIVQNPIVAQNPLY
ncbi:MAG: RagB/SusD family nutrient uptake outer membrane protein [Chitinophagaceae bacterium]